jgi:4'-phosphopantetheinyl transferase EntD
MLTNVLPDQLSAIILDTFSSIPCPPVVLKLLPAASEIPPEAIQNKPYIFLHSSELAQLQKYRLPKRRSEYLTGRICAKITALNYLQFTLQTPPAMHQIEINNSEYGHPLITFHPTASFPVPDISISHSKGYGAAVAAQHRCGIDIQRQEKSLIKVKEKYCMEREYHILSQIIPEGGELARLSLLWSAKEAIQKSFSRKNSMPTFPDICLQGGEKKDKNNVLFFLSLPPNQSRLHQKFVTVAAGLFMDYAIAVAVFKEKD